MWRALRVGVPHFVARMQVMPLLDVGIMPMVLAPLPWKPRAALAEVQVSVRLERVTEALTIGILVAGVGLPAGGKILWVIRQLEEARFVVEVDRRRIDVCIKLPVVPSPANGVLPGPASDARVVVPCPESNQAGFRVGQATGE